MLSIPHMIIIFIVALVFFGPEKLPELARNVGKVMAEFKRATGDFRSTFEDHLRDLEREADQRRISQAAAAANAAAPQPEVAPQTPGTDASTPATPVAGAVPAKAPWEQATDATTDAVSVFGGAPESPKAQSSDSPDGASENKPNGSSVNPDLHDKPNQESAGTHEPPVHDDLPA
jgi:sec-independent protein translocase protein TatB